MWGVVFTACVDFSFFDFFYILFSGFDGFGNQLTKFVHSETDSVVQSYYSIASFPAKVFGDLQ
jgi:hypothetical protein